MGNIDETRYDPALDESAFVKQRRDRLMTMHQRMSGYSTSGYSIEDHSCDGEAERSTNPTPIPTDGLLFKLAVCIGGVSDRLFGCTGPDCDPIGPAKTDYPLDGYCGF